MQGDKIAAFPHSRANLRMDGEKRRKLPSSTTRIAGTTSSAQGPYSTTSPLGIRASRVVTTHRRRMPTRSSSTLIPGVLRVTLYW